MEIPLFPLHTVLCPGIVLPLHIFEERYRAMTRHLLETGGPFGVVLIREGREVGGGDLALAPVGALAEIREAGRYADGRYDLLAAGTGRFAIQSVDQAREPYLVADVRPLEEEVGDEARAERLAASAIRRFVRYLELMRERAGESNDVLDIRVEIDAPDASAPAGEAQPVGEPEATVERVTATGDEAAEARSLTIPDDPTVLSYLLSGIVQVELPKRQALLEAPTTTDRLEALLRLLDRELVFLGRRWRVFAPDPGAIGGVRRS